MATNDFTKRYLERRRELGLSNGQTTTQQTPGRTQITTPASANSNASKPASQGTARQESGNSYTSGYLAKRRELMGGGVTGGQTRPSATLPSIPSLSSSLRRFTPTQLLQDVLKQSETTRPAGGQTTTPTETMSSADMSARLDELRELRDTAEADRNEARTVLTGVNRYGTQAQREEWNSKLEQAEADYSRYDQEYNELLDRYYQTENEEKRTSLQQDKAMSGQYQSAQDIQADMDKVSAVMAYTVTHDGDAAQVEEYKQYLFDKYGLDQKAVDQYAISGAGGAYVPRTDGGYNNIYELYLELQEKKENAVSTLSEGGYDYERMTGYEDMLEDAAQYREDMEEWQEYAREHPILSSVDTLLTAPFQGFDFLRVMGQNIGHSDRDDPENYVPMNSYDMELTNYINAVRQTVSEEIEGATNWEIFDQNVAAFLYQTGMSIGDSSLNLLAFGPTGALVVGSSTAAANQAKDIIDRGGSKEQAFMGGMAAGAFEAIFEKVSIDNLLATKSVTGWKSWLKETAKQAGIEASEETFTEIANILADAAIMGDNSNYDVAVAEYVAHGMSQEDAERQAFFDLIGQVVQAGVGGAISGGVMGGAVNGVNGMANAAYNRYNQQLVQENDVKNAPILETNPQEGPVQSQNEGEIDSSIPEATRQAVEMLVRGEEISGNQAARIAESEEAVALLSQLTGEEVNTDAPISRVKSDIRALASSEGRTSGEAGVNSRATQNVAQTQKQQNAERPTAQRAYDILRVQQAATTLGESGSRALTAAYDGSVDADRYYAGFTAYYEAGLSGRAQEQVRSDYAADLTEAQRYAAYTAGQNDAAASLQREKRAAQFAQTAGEDSGLVYDDFVREAVESGRTASGESGSAYLTQETADRVNSVAKALGLRVRFVDQVDGGRANAEITGSEVQIEKNNPLPVQFLMGHEVTHRLQELAPEEYRAFREAAAQDEMAQTYVRQYLEGDSSLTYEQALDEAAADYAGRLLEDGELLDQFIGRNQDNRTLLEKIRDAVRTLVRRLTGAEKRAAQTAEGKLSAALKAGAKRAETLQERQGDGTIESRYSRKDLTQEEEGALLRYKSGESYQINAKLRDGVLLTESEQKMVDELDRALEKLPTHEGVVYRRLSFDMEGQEALDNFLASHEEKTVARSAAYISSSTAMDGYPVSGELTTTQIITSRTGRDMSGIGNNNESEILFARNTRFYVEKIETDADGKTVIYMEEVAKHGAGQLYSEEYGQTVQQMQTSEGEDGELQNVSGVDTRRGADRGGMSGLRAEGDGEEGGIARESRKGFSVDRELDQEIRQIVREAREGGKSETEVRRAIRDTMDRALERQKEQQRATQRAARGRRSARELRERIERHVAKLSKNLRKPTDKQHIPEQLRTAVAAMLDAINLESVYTVDPETGKRRKGGEGDPTKRTEAFRALREQYEAILNRPDDYNYVGVLDPNLMDNLAEVIRMRDTPLFEMSLDQLTTVWQTVKGVEASITSANKLLGESRYAGVAELAYGIRESSRGKRQKNNYGGNGLGRITGFGDQLLNTDMMNSLTFLHLFGDGGDALYHELQAARDQKTRIMQETVRLAKQVVGKTNVDKLQKKIHTFQLEGGELKLSTAQLMSLYELNQRQQAQDHIYKGGIRPGPRSSSVSRDKSPGENVAAVLGRMDAPSSVVRVTQADVVNMLSELSEEEIRIADGLQSIMQGYLADEGNRESMKVYGYEKFTEDHYFPISSDPNQVQSKIGDILEGGERRPVSVSEWGSAKSTVTGANNGLLLGDIFDVFAQHAVDMSTYASHLGVLEDVNRVRNFAFRNAEGHRSGTIKEIIQRVAGKGGNAYLDKLLQDISRGTARGGVAGLSRLTANYKAASVGLNLRVALQQPTSYARALAVMSPKYLADPRVLKSGGWKKALKYAPIAQWKDWGNFEINQGRQFQNILFDTDSPTEKLRNRTMIFTSFADSITWGRLWNACELEILDTRPSLQEGSEEFYSAVAQRFTDVVDQTQVVDNVLGRSQFMRSGDNLAKMAASYMGEPTQTYNMLYRAYRDTAQEQDPKKRSQAIKRLGRTAAAVTFSAFMTAVAAALWDGVRDDEDRDEKYWERVLKHIGPNFAQNVNPVGMLPYARDILSIVQGYDVSRMDLEAVTSLFSALQNMQKAVNGEGRYTVRGAALNLAAELARITGLPLATVKRDAQALARFVGVETEDWYFQYQVERALNSVFYSGNRGEFYDIAFGALADGELDVYEQITQDLMSSGVKGSTIESAMRSRLKAAQESDPNFSMSQAGQDLIGGRPQYHVEAEEKGSFSADDLSPEARTNYNEQRAGDYREWVNALEGNGGFGKLDDEGKDKLLSAADQLASDIALRDHSQGAFTETDMDQWERWASKGAEYGVDPSEALLFKTAYDMAESEKDEDGDPISGSKKENALELAADLMPWLTDRELEYLMSNYWAPEDRALKELKEGKFLR